MIVDAQKRLIPAAVLRKANKRGCLKDIADVENDNGNLSCGGNSMNYKCEDIAKMIDHSLLRPELTEEDIRKGCEIARKYKVATVCCSPSVLALVKQLLEGYDVKATTVLGFPHGYNKTETKVFEAEQAIKDGAVELDMVINIGKLLGRDFDYVKNDIKAVVDAAHRQDVLVKVILENCYLTDELKQIACRLAEEAGADFVKTSTGFGTGGATLEDLQLMRKTVSEKVQVKAAGGVRDLDMAEKVREAGCTRFGATRTETIMEECYKREGKTN
ncbi:MAG TPA: deoxyribose-phosphate aldolase [Sedimentisphaerales bacterium]|nr:deoxyribose-phosphate aldolase [Sedimentisphaerales bacterium]